jgi:MarR family transcriptional regulator, lower aerobic nicotinate degradation pathway regulator
MDMGSKTMPAASDLEGDLGLLLSRLGTATRVRLAEVVAPLGLTSRQFLVLRTLAHQPGISQAALGERLRIDASSIVLVLDDCQKSGLAERRPSPEDRRRYAIHLTDSGRAKLDQAAKAIDDLRQELFAPLSVEQQAQLHDLLTQLARSGPLASMAASMAASPAATPKAPEESRR